MPGKSTAAPSAHCPSCVQPMTCWSPDARSSRTAASLSLRRGKPVILTFPSWSIPFPPARKGTGSTAQQKPGWMNRSLPSARRNSLSAFPGWSTRATAATWGRPSVWKPTSTCPVSTSSQSAASPSPCSLNPARSTQYSKGTGIRSPI